MARYGMDYGRDQDAWEIRNRRGMRYDEWSSGPRGGGWQGGPGVGGMRSDGWGSDWRSFPGESGWMGEGYAGYPSGSYDTGFERGMGGGRGFAGGERGWSGMRDAGQGYDVGFGGRGAARGGFGTPMVDPRGGWSDPRPGRGMSRGGGRDGQRGSGRGQVRAADLMTENPECVTADTTVADVARKMKELDVGIIPVVDSMEGRRLRGVITDRDIAIRAVAEGKDGKARVGDVMTSDVETCNKNDSMDEIMSVMQREQIRRVPITDREGRLVGIIAQADLVVDYGGYDPAREARVEHTIERISEPARPERGRSAAMSAQGRSRNQPQEGAQK